MNYICAYCGTEFGDIEARAKCELRCAEKRRKEEAEKKKELEELERLAAEKELFAIKTQFDEKKTEYIKKYRKLPSGICCKCKTGGNEDDFWADLFVDLLNI